MAIITYFLCCISVLDGCLPESTIVQDPTQIMWPEAGITEIAIMECPCGTVSCTITCQRPFSLSQYPGPHIYTLLTV